MGKRTGRPRGRPQNIAHMEFLRAHKDCVSEACIPWPFVIQPVGYGSYYQAGRNVGAHRAMCILAHGQPPFAGAQAAHSCGNRACVNPGHLRWATLRENKADELQDGTRAQGERNGSARLTGDDVLQIYADDRRPAEVAIEFGCSVGTVKSIRLGATWSHVTGAQKRIWRKPKIAA